MRLSNTLTSDLTDLRSLSIKPDAPVTLYSCGPTVYNHVTIGNLRTFITDDLLRRTLRATGQPLKSVMNITDVDDKTIARSRVEHPDLGPMEALIETTRAYESIFKHDLEAVGVDQSLIKFSRATDSIDAMKRLITLIYDNGFAYAADESIYFNLKKYRAEGHKYGRLANINYSAQARIDNDEYDKAEASDFALWKGAKTGEPFWEFELDGQDLPGRPGWHIECSAMALTSLGQPVTVHSGGIDLKFPHHENELAQVVGATGNDFAQIFTHHNHLYVNGSKMSKSLNNFYTLEDIKSKGYHPLAFRLLCLQARHTSELNFTWDSLGAAQNALLALYQWADLTHQTEATSEPKANEMDKALGNDLDSPQAMAILADLTAKTVPTTQLLEFLDNRLGLNLSGRPDVSDEVKDLIKQRTAAREAKDWPAADKLRRELAAHNIEIDDTPHGPRWRRTTLEVK